MIGHRSEQKNLWDADGQYWDFVGEDSFYGWGAPQRHELFCDDDFAELYCKDNGRPSGPPMGAIQVAFCTCLGRYGYAQSPMSVWGQATTIDTGLFGVHSIFEAGTPRLPAHPKPRSHPRKPGRSGRAAILFAPSPLFKPICKLFAAASPPHPSREPPPVDLL